MYISDFFSVPGPVPFCFCTRLSLLVGFFGAFCFVDLPAYIYNINMIHDAYVIFCVCFILNRPLYTCRHRENVFLFTERPARFLFPGTGMSCYLVFFFLGCFVLFGDVYRCSSLLIERPRSCLPGTCLCTW